MEITVREIVYALITSGVLGLVIRLLWQLVSAKTGNSRYAEAVDAVFAAVNYVNQVFVDSLKASGSFDKVAQTTAMNKAKEAALTTMSAAAKRWVESATGDLDEWLTVMIESAVKEAKT